MRRTNLLGGMLLLGALSFSLLAQAQQPEDKIRLQSTDVAVTYSAEGGKVAPSKSDRFWMHGGSAEAAFTFYRGLGLAVNINGQHASSIAPGVDVNKVSFVVGPRYSYDTTRFTERWLKSRKTSVFGETLMGATHAFNGLFPSGMQGIKSSTNAFAAQIGGGVNVSLAKGFGLRPFQMDYIYTALPNTGTDAQHDIRLSIGVTYHIGK